MTEKKFCA